MVMNRRCDVKTKRHLILEKKKAVKEEIKNGLLVVRKELTTTQKSQVDPLLPISATRCNQCGRGFGDVSGARSHRREKHTDCRIQCPMSNGTHPTCGCVFETSTQLNQHKEYHGKGIRAAAEEEDGEEEDEEKEMLFLECEKMNCNMM